MKINTWHWARLKKDLLIDDKYVLHLLKKDLLIDDKYLLHFTETKPFTIPKGTFVWACFYTVTFGIGIRIAVSDKHIEKNSAAYQLLHNINYSDLLEPLE